MNKSLIFAVFAFAAVVCVTAKPSYGGVPYNAPLYSAPLYPAPAASSSSAAAAAAASSSSAVPSVPVYLNYVPSYSIHSGYSGYAIPSHNYAPIY